MIKYKYAEVASIEKQGMSFTNLEKAMLGRIASIDCSDVDCSHCQLHISDGPIGYRCLAAIIRQSNMSEDLFTMIKDITCKMCGKTFTGNHNARYCETCKANMRKSYYKKGSFADPNYKGFDVDVNVYNGIEKASDAIDQDVREALKLHLSYGQYRAFKEGKIKLERIEERV